MRTVRQQRARGVVAAVAGATLLVSMLALPGGASATPVRAARFPQCTAAALDVWLNTAGVGSAGRLTYELNFTNLSSRTCTLFGYPGVSGINQSGHQLGFAAGRDTTRAPVTIALTSADGAQGLSAVSDANTATVVLEAIDTGALGTCHHVVAAGLRVYAPGQTRSSTIPFPFVACSNRGPVYLYVGSAQRR